MVTTIIIIISILLSFMIGVICTTKAIQLGLRWQIQTNNKQEPEIKSVITPKQPESPKQEYTKEIINEWLYGQGVE